MSDAALPIALQALGLGAGAVTPDALASAIRDLKETQMDLDTRLLREGDPWMIYGNGSVAAPGTSLVNTSLVALSGIPTIGKATYLRSMTISCDQPALVQTTLTGSDGTGAGRFPANYQQVVAGIGGPVVLPLGVWVRGFSDFNATAALSLRKLLTATGGETISAAFSLSGYTLSDDLDFDAPKTILVVGDSRDNGSSGTKTANIYKYRFKQTLAAAGTRARLVHKARSGINMAEQLAFANGGWHDISRVDLVIVDLGINDAIQGVSGASFVANLSAYWGWFNARYPSAKMIVVGPTPLADNTAETAAVAIRSAISAWVTAQALPSSLAYIDLGSSFNRATTSNYMNSDGVHPSDAAQSSMYTTWAAAWNALAWTI